MRIVLTLQVIKKSPTQHLCVCVILSITNLAISITGGAMLLVVVVNVCKPSKELRLKG